MKSKINTIYLNGLKEMTLSKNQNTSYLLTLSRTGVLPTQQHCARCCRRWSEAVLQAAER